MDFCRVYLTVWCVAVAAVFAVVSWYLNKGVAPVSWKLEQIRQAAEEGVEAYVPVAEVWRLVQAAVAAVEPDLSSLTVDDQIITFVDREAE